MTPPRYSEYLHSKIAGSRLEVIEGAGHMLPMEQPEEYNRRVAAFVGGLA
jgi:pimeloyl-ACP methyl ester carboxylesterase